MVDALASDRSDQSVREAVLPRRAWSDRFVADAHGSQSMPDGNAIDLIPIADQVARGLIPRECLCDLARDPVGGRMSQGSGQRIDPWLRCPVNGYAGRCAILGRAARIA